MKIRITKQNFWVCFPNFNLILAMQYAIFALHCTSHINLEILKILCNLLESSIPGKLCVPLLSMKNNNKKWWALKDKTLRTRAKGTFPQIQLEFELAWSPLLATYVTLNPKKEIHMKTVDKFRRQVFVNNVMRIKEVILGILDFVGFIKSCLEWEDVPRSVIAFIIFMTVTYYFEPYMAPIGLLLFFLKHYIVKR